MVIHKRFNKQNNRKNALFDSPFKRIRIDSDDYLIKSIIYVHQNSMAVCDNLENYLYSSYKNVLSSQQTDIKRNEVLEIFGGTDNFIYCHKSEVDLWK